MAHETSVFFIILQLVTLHGINEGCRDTPWEEGLVNEDVLNFHCSSGHYIKCSDPDTFESDIAGFEIQKVCGIVLECSGDTTRSRLDVDVLEDGDLSTADFLVLLKNCGARHVKIGLHPNNTLFRLHLHLPYNSIEGVDDVDVRYSKPTEIRSLNMSGNSLRALPSLSQIQVADFSNNLIELLGKRSLTGLENLRWVSLETNRITTVPHLGIQNTSEVSIFLNENSISAIEHTAFIQVIIDILDLSDNSLTAVTSDMFNAAKRVTTLRLRSNQIASIEKGSFAQTGTSTLDISGNLLVAVPSGVFSSLPGLKSLSLSGNKIHSFASPDPFDKSNMLEYLDLSDNLLEGIPNATFTGMPGLRTLLLSSNKLKTLGHNSFNGLSLGVLDISNNPIRVLDEVSFIGCSVGHLRASKCNFLEFPEEIVKQLGDGLRVLDLSDNMIKTIPSVYLEGGSPIDILDLSHNLIDTINCSLVGETLDVLYLHNNAISHIKQCQFTERIFSSIRFSLGQNPLQCCELQWLRQITIKAGTLLDPNSTTCRSLTGEHVLIESPLDESDCTGTANPIKDHSNGTNNSNGAKNLVPIAVGVSMGLLLIVVICIAVFIRTRRERVQPPREKVSHSNATNGLGPRRDLDPQLSRRSEPQVTRDDGADSGSSRTTNAHGAEPVQRAETSSNPDSREQVGRRPVEEAPSGTHHDPRGAESRHSAPRTPNGHGAEPVQPVAAETPSNSASQNLQPPGPNPTSTPKCRLKRDGTYEKLLPNDERGDTVDSDDDSNNDNDQYSPIDDMESTFDNNKPASTVSVSRQPRMI